MTASELCEPFFQYVCLLNRSSRQGAKYDLETVRSEINALFASLKAQAAGDPRLDANYEKLRRPLAYFVDATIAGGRSSIAQAWDKRRLAYEWQEFAGDEKFWDLLEETLNEQTEDATERLAVYYTCVGLGFTGLYYGKPDLLKRKMAQMSERTLRGLAPAAKMRLCPEAYDHVDRRILCQRPASTLVGIVIAVFGLLAVLFILNAVLYQQALSDLRDSFRAIAARASAVARADAPRTTPEAIR